MRRVLAADNAAERKELSARIDGLLAEGQDAPAARLVREALGMSWDEAHAALARWPDRSAAQRTHWLRLAQLHKALSGH